MTEDKIPIKDYGPHKGMSTALPSYLLPQGKYLESFNVRCREGRATTIEPLHVLWQLDNGIPVDTSPVTALSPFFSEGNDSLFIALSQRRGYLLNFAAEEGVRIPFPSDFSSPDDATRWSVLAHFSGFYCTNKLSGLYRFNGVGDFERVVTVGPTLYPKYIENFHDHLVMANIKEDGQDLNLRIAWSELGDFHDFVPTSTNEADFFDLEPSGYTAASGLGITGIKKIGDLLAIYTTDSVWLMQYVGFDNGVMRIEEYVQGTGNWLPYSLVGVDRYHGFVARDNIYLFDGASFTPIGNDIRRYFFNDLTLDSALRNRTFGYVNVPREEVWWFYHSRTSAGVVDKAIVWNFRERNWFIASGAGRTAAISQRARTYNWIDLLTEDSATIDGLTAVFPTIDDLTTFTFIDYDIYAVHQGATTLYRDLLGTDDASTLEFRDAVQGQAAPYLITRDIVPEDPFTVDDYESMRIDWVGTFLVAPGLAFEDGVKVYSNVRDYIGEPVMDEEFWNYLYFLGPESLEPHYRSNQDFRHSAHVLRFKFVFENVTNVTFNGFAINRCASQSNEK